MPTETTLGLVKNLVSDDNSLINFLQSRIGELEVELEQKKSQIKIDEENLVSLEKEINDKKESVSKATTSFSEAKETYQNLFEACSITWTWEKEFEDAIQSMMDIIAELELKVTELNGTIAELEQSVQTIKKELKELKSNLVESKKLKKELIELINESDKLEGGLTRDKAEDFLSRFKKMDGSLLFENLAEAAQIVMFPESYGLLATKKTNGSSITEVLSSAFEQERLQGESYDVTDKDLSNPFVLEKNEQPKIVENEVSEISQEVVEEPVMEAPEEDNNDLGKWLGIGYDEDEISQEVVEEPIEDEDQKKNFIKAMGFTEEQINNPKYPISLRSRTLKELEEFISIASEYGMQPKILGDLASYVTFKNPKVFRRNLEDIVEGFGKYYESEKDRHPFSYFKLTRVMEERDENNAIVSDYVGKDSIELLNKESDVTIPEDVAFAVDGLFGLLEENLGSDSTPYAYVINGEFVAKTKVKRNLEKLLLGNSNLPNRELVFAACTFDGTRNQEQISNIAEAFGISTEKRIGGMGK